MIKRLIMATAAVLSMVTLSGCQSSPQPVALNPQLSTSASGDQISLRVRDQRAQNHIMRLEQNDNTAEFATADPSLASLISDRMGERWEVVEEASAHLELTILDALFVIKQGSLRHDSTHNVRLHAKLTTADAEFEKTFRGSRESNGPLRADIRRIEREFAGLLADVLTDIAEDEQLTSRIHSAQ